MLKQLVTPKESQHVSIKQQNGKVQDEFENKKGQEKNNHKYYQRNQHYNRRHEPTWEPKTNNDFKGPYNIQNLCKHIVK